MQGRPLPGAFAFPAPAARFPEDFMFQLTAEEAETLRSQFATSNGRGGRRYIPYAFSELGVAMLSSVLNSERAVQVNIAIMRAFARLRELAASHKDEWQTGSCPSWSPKAGIPVESV